jgi:hypothetical protein
MASLMALLIELRTRFPAKSGKAVTMYSDHLFKAQMVLRRYAGYSGDIDGRIGPMSLAAADRVLGSRMALFPNWPVTPERVVVAAAQIVLSKLGFASGSPDGFWGPQTDAAFDAASDAGALVLGNSAGRVVGGAKLPLSAGGREDLTEADIASHFGAAGGAACTAGVITPPWRMFLAWNEAEEVHEFRCHQDVQQDLQHAFSNVADTHNAAEIQALGLHLYGGCFNHRNKRGSDELSTHAWGIAIDLNPGQNRLKWRSDRARFARPDARKFLDAFEAEGFYSLGRAKNFDYMHLQAVKP